MEEKGCIHIYHGEGKGKTTCAMGLVLRFSHYGKKVLVIQCLKDGTSGEILQLKNIENVDVLAKKVSSNFTWEMTDEEKEITKKQLEDFFQIAFQGKWDLLVVDEVCSGLSTGLLDENLVKKLLELKKIHQELVFTGRNPPDFLVDVADYVTYFKAEKHPYEQGIAARQGIEY